MADLLLDLIKAKLVTDGIANTTTWRCFIGFCPDLNDQAISLHFSGGFAQDTMENENLHETFQLRVRTPFRDYSACYAKWRDLYDALHDANLAADSIFLIQAMSSGPLEFFDAAGRVNMTANFRCIRSALDVGVL